MIIKKIYFILFLVLSMMVYGFSTPLIDAIYNNDWALVDELIEDENNLKPSNSNETPLMIASEYGYVEVVKKIIDKKVDLNFKNNQGITAIHRAINYNHTDVVKLLIDSGADIEITDNEGKTPLMTAAAFLATGSFELLVKAGAEIDKVDNYGLNALYFSIEPPVEQNSYIIEKSKEYFGEDNVKENNSYPDMTLRLIELGSNMDFILPNGIHIFFKVCSNSSIDVVDKFLEKGFDINMKDKEEFTPIIYSSSNKNRDVLPYLIENGANPVVVVRDGIKATTSYALYCTPEQLQVLKDKGVDFEERDPWGYNNVYHALTEGNLKGAIWFLQNGLEYNNPGTDIFNYAMTSGNKELLNEILKQVEDINVIFENGSTPAMLALRYYDSEVFNNILEMGASIEGSDNNGFTIIHYASSFSNTQVLESLIKKVENPLKVNNNGQSPLSLAMNSGNTETAIYLINNGSDINLIDNEGNSPLIYSIQFNLYDVFIELCKNDPDFLVKDKYGRSLLEIANNSNNRKFSDYLLEHKKSLFEDEVNENIGLDNNVNEILQKLNEVILSTPEGYIEIKNLLAFISEKRKNGRLKFLYESQFQTDNIESIIFYPVSYSEANIYFSKKSLELYKTNPSIILSQLVAEMKRAMFFFEDSYFYAQVQNNPLEQFLFDDSKYEIQAKFIYNYLLPNNYVLTSMEELLVDSFLNNKLQKFTALFKNFDRSIVYIMNNTYKNNGSSPIEKRNAVNELGKQIYSDFSLNDEIDNDEKYYRVLKNLTFIKISPQVYFGIKELEDNTISPDSYNLRDYPEIFKSITDCQSVVTENSDFLESYIDQLNKKYLFID